MKETNLPTNTDLLAKAQEFARTGQHTRAIELCTLALASTKIEPALQMDLLESRAESYTAMGKLDQAEVDVAAMLKLARDTKEPLLKAQALNTQANVQMRRGDLKDALKSATSAVKTRHNSPLLRAKSLLTQSEAFMRTGQATPMFEAAEQALPVFLTNKDYSGAGRAYMRMATADYRLGRIEDSRRFVQIAIDYCRQAGDLVGVGNAFNAYTFSDSDIAERISHLQQALQAFESAGYIERRAVILGNLALAFMDLGLYPHANRLQNEVLSMYRSIGARGGLTYAVGNLIGVKIYLRDVISARSHMLEFEELVDALGDPEMVISLEATRGDLAFAEGNLQQAAEHFKKAAEISVKDVSPKVSIFLTQYGQMLFLLGDLPAALEATTHATELHRSQGYALPDGFTNQEIWWRHSQSLKANKKNNEAREALERSYQFLLDSIASLRDEGLRRNYLNKVAVNREIIEAWLKDGKKRRLPDDRLYAHLAFESNVREPFKRLADSGLRLNTLHTQAEIQTFLVEEATELSGGKRVLLVAESDEKREVSEAFTPDGEDRGKILLSINRYLDQARFTRSAQLEVNPDGESRIVAPLIAQNNLLGYLYVDLSAIYGRLTETDRDMLGMLANQAAIALMNAEYSQGLEQKVEERTAELNQRADELAILNSVGEAMAKTLDVKTVTRIVGDKVKDIFKAETVAIMLLDASTNMIHVPFEYDEGEGGYIDYGVPFPLGKGMTSKVIFSQKPLTLGTLEEQWENGSYVDPAMLEKGSGVFCESSLMVPIFASSGVIGVVSIGSYKQHAFDENHQRLLQTLSSNMGVAIQNARLFEAEQQRVAELQIINTIQQGLAAELDFQAIVDLVGDKLREIFETPDIAINWYDEKTGLLHPLYTYEHGVRNTFEPVKPNKGGIFETVSKTRQALVFNNLEDYKKFNARVVPGTDQSQSLAAVPIISSDRVLGTIILENFERENAYGESELRLLTTVAASLGTALENARLFGETQRLLKETDQRAAELAIINSVQQGLASKLDLQSIVDLVGDKIREIMKTDDIGIRLYDEKADLIHYLYEFEHGRRLQMPSTKPSITGNFRKMLIDHQPVYGPTASFDTPVVPGTDISLAMASVPIIAGDKVTGAITIESFESENFFDESKVRLMQTIAASMGVALENARLFDETQRLLKETEQRAAELAIINSVQEGLASKLDMQAIYDLVGDKIQEIFDAQAVNILRRDTKANTLSMPYVIEKGKRYYPVSEPLGEPDPIARKLLEARQPVLINTVQEFIDDGVGTLEGTEQPTAGIFAPMFVGDEMRGVISIQSVEKEYAFSAPDVRLLQTLASSMSVALENARLFDETQRLLKETEQRAAELAVINSIQEGVSAELDFQAIVDLVGDKLREVLNTGDIGIRWFDHKEKKVHYLYEYEHGVRLTVSPTQPIKTPWEVLTSKREPRLKNTAEEVAAMQHLPGTDMSKSNIVVDIIASDRVIGSIMVDNFEKEFAFSDSDIRLLSTVASSMGVALENARLFDETQRLLKETEQRNAELAIINSVQAALSAELNIQGIYEAVGDKIREIFHNTDVGIRIYDPKTNLVHFPYMSARGKRQLFEPITLPQQGFGPHVIRTRETLVINENMPAAMEKYGSYLMKPENGQGLREKSAVYVPLVSGDQARGLISLNNFDMEHAFSESDVRLLQTLANSMSVALENARLFDETQRLLKETEERNSELAVINSVQAALAAELNIQGIYDAVGDKIREIFHNRDMGIRIYDPQTSLVYYPYTFENGERINLDPNPLGEKGFEAHILRTREAIVINESMALAMEKYGSYIIPGTKAEKSAIYVPLIAGDQARGLINLIDMDREHAFSNSDVRLLSTLANSMSVALENARLFNETQRLLKETEQRNAELAIINSVQDGLAK